MLLELLVLLQVPQDLTAISIRGVAYMVGIYISFAGGG